MASRVLIFSYDTELLSAPDPENESQFRQQQYADLLNQERHIIVMALASASGPAALVSKDLHIYNACSRWRWLAFFRAVRIGMTIGRTAHVDCIEYQDPQLAGCAAYAVARLTQAPLIGGVFTDFFNNPEWYRRNWISRLYHRVGEFVIRRTQRVRCDSQELTRSLQAQGYPATHVPFLIPWLEQLKPTQAEVSARLVHWKTDPVILYVGRLSAEKNVEMLLQAFAALENPRAQLQIIGRGPHEDVLKAQARQLQIEQRVSWLGFVSYEALVRHFKKATLFAFPSNFESTARVLVQAQAAQLPTVATNTSGTANIVLENRTGLIVPTRDLKAFRDAMTRVLTDPSSYETMLRESRAYIWDQYGLEAILLKLTNFYEGVHS